MKISEKLTLIMKEQAITQSELASKLKVSFPTVNSWILEKSLPRKSKVIEIDKLFKETFKLQNLPDEKAGKFIFLLNRIISESGKINYLKMLKERKDILDDIILRLTYSSNSIEGSTLTLAETREVLFFNRVPGNKKTVEILEAKNHENAIRWMLSDEIIKSNLSIDFILQLHTMLMQNILVDHGKYRTHAVRILGSFVPTANYLKIPDLMEVFLRNFGDVHNISKDKILNNIAKSHAEFEKIHPFSDGNGRIGRLIVNFILLKANFPVMIINPEDKTDYYIALEDAQLKYNYSKLEQVILEGIEEGYKFFI